MNIKRCSNKPDLMEQHALKNVNNCLNVLLLRNIWWSKL